MMSRVELSKLPALTFCKGALTAARRTSAWPQLSCSGSACKLYQPEVVRCVNLGGSGTDIDWKVWSLSGFKRTMTHTDLRSVPAVRS